jgi:hypothetical protein
VVQFCLGRLQAKNFGPLKADSTLRREAWTARRGHVHQHHGEAGHANRGSTRKPTVLLHAAQQSISSPSRRIAQDPCSTPELHVSALTTTQGFWAGLPLWAKRHLDGVPVPLKLFPGQVNLAVHVASWPRRISSPWSHACRQMARGPGCRRGPTLEVQGREWASKVGIRSTACVVK